MRKNLLLITLISISGLAQAQSNFQQRPIGLSNETSDISRDGLTNSSTKVKPNNDEKAVACSDKVTYTYDNNLGGVDQAITIGGVTGWEFAAQSFPDFTGQVTAVEFRAKSNMAAAKPLIVNIHAINSGNYPVGSPIGTATVSVGTSLTNYNVTFTNPVNVTNGFAVVMWDAAPEGNDADSLSVYVGSEGSGLNEGYSFLYHPEAGSIINILANFNGDVDVLVNPTIKFNHATPSLSSNISSLCAGNQVNFTIAPNATLIHYDHPIYNPDFLDYSLDFGDGTANGTTTSASHTYSASGNYTAEATSTYVGRTSECISEVATLPITVNGLPDGFFSYQATGLSVQFNDLSVNSTTTIWNFGDGGTAASPNPIRNYAAPGTYTVELTVTGPCGSDLYFKNITIADGTNSGDLSIEENADIALSIYPNPTNDMVNISYELAENNDFTAQLISPIGSIVSTSVISNALNGEFQIDLSQLASGIYSLKLNVGEKIIFKKIVKN